MMTPTKEPAERAAEEATAEREDKAVVVRDLTARGVRVRFSESGEGPSLFLLHGFLQTRVAFESVRRDLAKKYRVICPDFPGFGESEKPDPRKYAYGYVEFASVVADLVSALGVGRALVCGVGMGANVALMVAGEHKDLVKRLVLVSPIVYEHTPSAFERVLGVPVVGALVFKQIVNMNLFSRHFGNTIYREDFPSRYETIERYYESFNSPAAREAAHATLRATQDVRPIVAIVPRVVAPTLVVCGRRDRRVPLHQARRLAREIPSARLEVLECGHAPPEELPGEFTSVLTRFLDARR